MPEGHFVQLTTAARVPSVDKKYARFKVSHVNSLMNEYAAIPRQRLWFSVPCSFIVTEERENRRFLSDNIQGGNPLHQIYAVASRPAIISSCR